MAHPTDKTSLLQWTKEGFENLMTLIQTADIDTWETPFIPQETKAKCTTFEQGDCLRDLLMHIYEWQRLQVDFVSNIRKGEPKDFIPEPYRKNYKEMDEVNRQRHQLISFQEAVELLGKSYEEIVSLIESFSEDELYQKKVFKVTYTTTMAAYFVSVSQYDKVTKRAKAHLRVLKKH